MRQISGGRRRQARTKVVGARVAISYTASSPSQHKLAHGHTQRPHTLMPTPHDLVKHRDASARSRVEESRSCSGVISPGKWGFARLASHWGWHHRRWGSWWGGGQGESGEPGPCSIPALKEKGGEHHLGTGADGCRGSMCSWRLGGRRRNVRRPKPRAGAAVTV